MARSAGGGGLADLVSSPSVAATRRHLPHEGEDPVPTFARINRIFRPELSMSLLTILAVNAAVSAVAFLALWAVSLRTKDVSFIDAWWGPSMALLAWSTLLQGQHTPHGLLLTGLCTLWAARLGLYLLWRWRKHGADRRYVAI
ncbi:MAG: DUF1295 domain-containing protein, partial [Caulobacter sp.]